MKAATIMTVGLALLLGSTSPAAQACSYDGMPLDLNTAHPASLPVALAIFEAYQGKRLAKPVALPGGFGMRRVQIMLEKLRVALAPNAVDVRFDLLLVEPGLWARFEGSGAALQLTLHTPPAAAGEAVVITGEGVLQALLQNTLSARQALDAGLLHLAPATSAQHWKNAFAEPGSAYQSIAAQQDREQ